MRDSWFCTQARSTGAHELAMDQRFTVVPGSEVSEAAERVCRVAMDQQFTVVPGSDVSKVAETREGVRCAAFSPPSQNRRWRRLLTR
jgi:putative aminopeptidase FrvX